MNDRELRRRLGLDEGYEYELRQWQQAYHLSRHEPIMVNQGGPTEEPFGPTLALLWAERLAKEWLG